MARPVSAASAASSVFQVRRRLPLEPPLSAVISSRSASRVGVAAAGVPPGAHRVHRERGGVVVGAHRHPSGVGAQVVDAVGDRLARLADEVVDLDLLRVAGGSVVAQGPGVVPFWCEMPGLG